MKQCHWLYATVLLLATGPALAATGNVNVFLGKKALDDSDWNSPYDDQPEFGVLFDFRDESWPISIAVDLLASAQAESRAGITYTASTSELSFGARKILELEDSSFHPYLGAGLALVSVRFEEDRSNGTFYDEEGGIGFWISGGLYWTLGEHFNLGVAARHSSADVRIGGVTIDAGGTHTGLILGYHW